MPQTKTRVVGSGNTVLRVNHKAIAFLMSFGDTAPAVVAGAKVIQGIDDKHPREIITANAVGGGTLSLSMVELWDAEAWQTILTDFRNANNILDVFEAQRRMRDTITCEKLIRLPNGNYRGKVYHGCVITAITEDENVAIETMEKSISIIVQYTHVTNM
jgi:hypothetical protein